MFLYSRFIFLLYSSLYVIALAPSSTFAPSVSVASPAKLQAAAALAEVANGIEGEVSHCTITEHLAGSEGLNKCDSIIFLSYRSKALSQPQ